MPELPEVENRLLYLRRTALGARVKRVVVTAPGMIKTSGARSFALNLAERSFVDAYRRGKYPNVALDNGRWLILHFGMGGDLVFYNSAEDKPEYTSIEVIFESGARLAFTCARKICRVMLVDSVEQVPALRDMGPEPGGKEFSLAYLACVIEESPARQIKPLLMDQQNIAGVGENFPSYFLVSRSARGANCKACNSEIERKTIGGRTAYFCPQCQS